MLARWARRASACALSCCFAVAGCQAPPPDVPPPHEATLLNGVGYVLFSAVINQNSSAMLIKGFDTLQARGAREIDLVLNSPGGVVESANAVVTDMDRLHDQHGITFKVWNLKMVASAATLIFLAAQQRYSYPHAGFLFHGPHLLAVGSFDAETLRRDADHIDQITQAMRETLLARTHLTPQQAAVYTTRTVILSADDARADGVVDGIGTLTAPPGVIALVIKQKPKAASPAQPPSAG